VREALPDSLPRQLDEPDRAIVTSTRKRSDGLAWLDAWLLRRRGVAAVALWCSLVAIYQIDDSVVEEGDAIANVELPIALLRTGKLHFTPRLSPIVFLWKSKPPLRERDDYYVRSWHERHEGRAAGFWYATGKLELNGPRYFAVESPLREAYVCTFGVIAGLTLLPLAALFSATDPDFMRSEWLKLSAAKLHASGLIAASAVLLFLLAFRYVRPRYALLLATAYALGTCVWAVSSDTLWQQTVSILLLSGVMYAFVRIADDDSQPARIWCGVLLAAALASRPTAVFFAVAIGVYLLQHRPKALPTIAWSGLPILIAVAVYNQYYFGSPMNFAQELIGHQIAIQKTGVEQIWQTPLIVGLVGLLASPSRGLLVFSPFLLASAFGVRQIWLEPKYATLRPLTVAAGAIMLVQCKWFDWWGGWAFGYRPWLEAIPVVMLCMLPVIESIFSRWWSGALFAAALAWSIFVQGVGALAYDKHWNARDLHRVDLGGIQHSFFTTEQEALQYAAANSGQYQGLFACNIDLPMCRYRLWSIDDNIISYYMHERYNVARDNRTHSGLRHLLRLP
jgi:hypothetical protein